MSEGYDLQLEPCSLCDSADERVEDESLLEIFRAPMAPGESILGFVLRRSTELCVGFMSTLRKVGVERTGGGWLDKTALKLWRILRLSEEAVDPRLRSAASSKTPVLEFANDKIVPRRIRRSIPKICPSCLEIAPDIARAVWELRPVHCCPEHGVYLIDLCPGCGHRLSWYREFVGACRCGRPLDEWPRIPAPQELIDLTFLMYQALGLNAAGLPEPGMEPKFDFEGLCRMLQILELLRSGRELQWGKSRDDDGRISKTLEVSLCEIMTILRGWPETFFLLLKQRRRASDTNPRSSVERDVVYIQILRMPEGSAKEFMLCAYQAWRAQRPRLGGDLLDRRLLEKAISLTGGEVRRILDIDYRSLRRLEDAGRLHRVSTSPDAGFEVASVVATFEEWTPRHKAKPLPLSDAARERLVQLFGCSEKHLRTVLRGCGLYPVRLNHLIGAEMEGVINHIVEAFAIILDCLPIMTVENRTNVRQLLSSTRRHCRATLGMVLALILKGKLEPVGRLGAGNGLDDLLFDENAKKALIDALGPLQLDESELFSTARLADGHHRSEFIS